jgi:hypothetical protein
VPGMVVVGETEVAVELAPLADGKLPRHPDGRSSLEWARVDLGVAQSRSRPNRVVR